MKFKPIFLDVLKEKIKTEASYIVLGLKKRFNQKNI